MPRGRRKVGVRIPPLPLQLRSDKKMKYMLVLYPPSAEEDDTEIVEDTPENRKLYEDAEKLIGGFDSPAEAFAQAMDYTREEDERGECPLKS